ncbi:MAG TPA: hypothetical protein VFZ08_15245, partial [Terriglobia bacterium]|nr:hypothetical protein [Terriglobia bacterium]
PARTSWVWVQGPGRAKPFRKSGGKAASRMGDIGTQFGEAWPEAAACILVFAVVVVTELWIWRNLPLQKKWFIR